MSKKSNITHVNVAVHDRLVLQAGRVVVWARVVRGAAQLQLGGGALHSLLALRSLVPLRSFQRRGRPRAARQPIRSSYEHL